MPRAGLVPPDTMQARHAKAYMLPTTASTRFAWNGVSASDECNLPGQLVGLGGARGTLYDAVQDVSVKLGRAALAFGLDVFGHEPIGQFGHCGHSTLCGLLIGRIVSVGH
jgi:hypothetical protein